MTRLWEKEAEDQYRREEKLVQSERRSNVGLNIFFGVAATLAIGAYVAIRWLFFDHNPTKDDLWTWVIAVLFAPALEWFYAPIRQRQDIQAKRAIRIEAKLDCLLEQQEEIATRLDDLES